jgi:hypothetical protein
MAVLKRIAPSECRRRDGSSPPHQPRAATRERSSQCRRKRARRPRRNADGPRPQSTGDVAAIADHDERGRESHQPYPPCETEREAVAWRADGGTLGRRWGPRSRQRLPSIEGAQGDAGARRRVARAGSTTWIRDGISREDRVVINRAAPNDTKPSQEKGVAS